MMKNYLIALLILVAPLFIQSQSSDSSGSFGLTVNSSFNGEVFPTRIVPSVTYAKGKNQVELGLGFHPFFRDNYKILSAELSHKYFPNGRENKYNMYFITQLAYINNKRETFNPSTYNYLFLNGGYGFEIQASAKVYVGINITAGAFTYSKTTEISNTKFASKNLFHKVEANLACQFNVGYRF